MDDTTFGTLENAVVHHNEWEGRDIILSVHESPELDELVDVDLAQCISQGDGKRGRHTAITNFADFGDDKVGDMLIFRGFDISMFRCFDVSMFRCFDVSMFVHIFLTFHYFHITTNPHFTPIQCYWFPKDFNINTPSFRSTKLTPLLVNACKKSGFSLIILTTRTMSGYDWVLYGCGRGRVNTQVKLVRFDIPRFRVFKFSISIYFDISNCLLCPL
jgi:hypothetical protein